MPKLLRCPFCSYGRSWILRRHHRKCKRCRREWSPGTQFPISGLRLVRREWLRIIDTFLRDGTILAVSRECHIAYRVAQRAVLTIRMAMAGDFPESFTGTCEADETYVGGSWKNKAVHIRQQGSKRGRGTTKQPIFGLAQRDPLRVRVWLLPDTKRRSLLPKIFGQVVRGSRIYTDGYLPYQSLPSFGYAHDWVDHEAGEYVRGEVHTQTIDGYWGLLKVHLSGIGGIRKRHLHLFIGEHQWRSNFRHLTRKEQTMKIYQLLTRIGGRK